MKKPLRILTFNHHESYLCSLSQLGHNFEVVTRYKSLDLSWSVRSQSVPENFELIVWDDRTKKKLAEGYYDLIICHTLKNLLWLFKFRKCRFIFVAHIPLFFYSLPLRLKAALKKTLWKIFKATHEVHFLAVSEFKRRMWGESGSVVILSPQQLADHLSEGTQPSIAIVCNDLASREKELGYEMIKSLQASFPINIIGNNPGVTHHTKPRNFDEFRTIFTQQSIYLYTIAYPYGDGYNTAMLEAMAIGMPVVTIANPSSPIQHGVNGLIGQTEEELAAHLTFLLNHPEEARRMGEAAKATIQEKFNHQNFLQGWRRAINLSLPATNS